MKAIIFYCIDNFDEKSKFVVLCDKSKVKEVVKDYRTNNTDIYDYEIVSGRVEED